MSPTTPFSTLARALSRGTRLGDLLPELHRELLAATGGTRSVVLEAIGSSGEYIGSSGRGFPALDTPLLRGDAAQALTDLTRTGTGIVSLEAAPPLQEQLGADRALLIPVGLARRPTILVVTAPAVPEAEAAEAAARAAVEFGIVLEWSRVAREGSFHRRMRELLLVFSRGVRSLASLAPALEIVAHEANVLFGAHRTAVWLHDRRARQLVLTASSDPAHDCNARVDVDASALPAEGLRWERPRIIAEGSSRMMIAPLRGWRRGLGTLIVEGPAAVDDEHLIELAHELGRQLAAGIENVQLLDEVHRQRRLLEDTFNSLADLVIVTDTSLRVVQVNDACVERLSRPREEMLERNLGEIVGEEVAAWAIGTGSGKSMASDTAVEALPTTVLGPRTFDRHGLPGIFSVRVAPLINQDGEAVGRVLVATDMTSQSRLEADREALRARLVQSEKLAALGQFVAGIAHEMNNPLQGILGHLELLIAHAAAAEPVRPELRRIFREAERASRIVRNLLVFTGSRRMKRRRLRVDRIIARALASRRVALERAGIEVVRRFPESIPTITGDPLLLQQAFLNIIINAEHAIAERGAGGRIETTVETHEHQVVLTVRDTGGGFPDGVLPRVFDPFFTTKGVGQGTGLGLAITYGIVQEHNGAITCDSTPGQGTRFVLSFPQAVGLPAIAGPAAR
jgi:signal transduction histidine kinase